MKNNVLIHSLFAAVLMAACNNGPKVIAPASEDGNTENGSGIFSSDPSTQVSPNSNTSFDEDLHKVNVQEVLPTERYIYLKVNEEGKQFWIATRKQAAKKGEIYYYRNGLLKTDFESKEYNRVFDTIYLVSNLVPEDHSKNAGVLDANVPKMEQKVAVKEDIPTHTDKITTFKGKVKIAEVVKDPKKYEGQEVEISGTCVKVNPNIMDRNWIHLQDGSKNDFDLVITSNTFVPEGSKVTMRGVVNLDRDFGAGYRYDLILEDGKVVE